MLSRLCCLIVLMLPALARADDPLPQAKPVPTMQVLPLPHDQISVTRNGKEISRYHFAPDLERPFLYPIVGPSGRSLTRMGHPHDPNGHSHHNSVWIAHHDVNGVDFWADPSPGKIKQVRVGQFVDQNDRAVIQMINAWIDTENEKPLLEERRTMTFVPLPEDEWLLAIAIQLTASSGPVTFGDTPFGPLGVRMAKTIGVHDGGGTIRNSEGQVDEKEVFRKPARWVDYSGPITSEANEGITLMNHRDNPTFPSAFHVRNDGWMGATMSHEQPSELKQGESLMLRYGLYVHAGVASPEKIEQAFAAYHEVPLLPAK
ncbi:PmoA family protein [Blastopirellula marina]|uniref:Methane oxygenase PmoA n=1 Tax=Blastopirellula marina TaxID=124 RepID=A0A2S8G1A0_9BACT|nr:PmoA family protein [Blastopirellula marina]PQO37904.1 hypothetical protein C5Y98_07350 [Blastopirellula marina]PTL44560.1 hypothetical protein C5Y97_07350 [Blastopirellula marina]